MHRAVTRGLQRGPGLYISLVRIYLGRIRVINKQKKKKYNSSGTGTGVVTRHSPLAPFHTSSALAGLVPNY